MIGPGCPQGKPEGPSGDRRLLREGWTPRFLADAARAAEALEIYRGMGLEERAESPSPGDFGEDCAGCAHTACRTYLMIYTRPQGTPR